MTAKTKPEQDYTGHKVVITREFDAPRDIVFQAWTDPQQLAQWWGPRGFTNPVCDWHPLPGRAIYVVMRAPNGAEYPMGGEFREVVSPERLVFTSGALDENKQLIFEQLQTVTFAEQDGKTLVKIHMRVLRTTAEGNNYLGGYEAGMGQSLDRLAEQVVTFQGSLVVERVFDATVEQVWLAITTPAAMKEWYFEIPEFQPAAGREFQFMVEHEGFKYFHQCRVAEVIPAQKLAYTWRYEGYEGDSLVTFELSAEGTKTRLKLTHTGLETFPKLPPFARKNFGRGWGMLIGNSLPEFLAGLAKN